MAPSRSTEDGGAKVHRTRGHGTGGGGAEGGARTGRRRPRQRLRLVSAALAGVGLLAATAIALRPSVASRIAEPVSAPSASSAVISATTGPLFADGLGSAPRCTAVTVATAAHDVIVTAAHCVTGSGTGLIFAPGYRDGKAPHGTWVTTRAYAPAGWLSGQDPHDDLVYLTVRPSPDNPTQQAVQTVVGGAAIGSAPKTGEEVTVAAYVADSADQPVVCSTRVYLTEGYPSFACPGYDNGSSGAPWFGPGRHRQARTVITAIIGGLRQGGCTTVVSYGVPLDGAGKTALARAAADGPGDTLPAADSDGC